MRILYTLAIFLSSALLFLVQPMVARIILPAYGGTASVWTTCELFFQAVLLLGYGYAHLSTRRLGPRKQPRLHLPLMALALITLPFATRVLGGAEGTSTPVFRLLGQLCLMVGLAFFAISAGAPLIQRWFADTRDPHARDPYFLYSASNLGSMVALLAYPALVEPRLRLPEQTRLWAGGFVVLLVLMGLCAVALVRSPEPEPREADPDEDTLVDAGVISNRTRAKWIALSAVPSSLLLGATAYISTNVAPIPLLWVVPLALYLLTFILVFKKRPLLSSRVLGRVTGLTIPPLMVAIVMEAFQPTLAFAHLLVFFAVAWTCHARLSESRPDARHLTEFYFWMSVGGVLGGAFNALVAPVIFNTLFEYPLALIFAALLLPPYRPDTKWSRRDLYYPLAVALVTLVAALVVRAMRVPPSEQRTLVTVGVPAILCFLAVDRPLRYGLSLAGMILVANGLGVASGAKVVLSARSFFGVHRVLVYRENGQLFHQLTHGNTVHGIQNRNKPRVPLTYYHPSGPIGSVFEAFTGSLAKKNVALVGLGVGSLAAYGQPDQNMTFYEIDPTVRDLATNPNLFSFVHDSRANVRIDMGDARLRLAKAPDHSYDLIVLDAFSSDSIPVHLLTREAAQMYLSKLTPDGFLAYHISNRYLELQGVLAAVARDLGLKAYVDEDGVTTDEAAEGKTASIWMILTPRVENLGPLRKTTLWTPEEVGPGVKAWTDDYSNVLGVLKQDD